MKASRLFCFAFDHPEVPQGILNEHPDRAQKILKRIIMKGGQNNGNRSNQKNGATLTVCPEGRLDTVRAPQLDKQLQPHLAGVSQITMDFSNVEYISSAGFRLLLWLEQEMEKRGGEVQVTRANDSVLKIITLAGFMNVVHVITE